tara:strand:- start:606 stop:1412 length:807 start_codon:yes stop_codon:yes gene_type:complete
MQTAEWLETNSRWLEALDPGSGRVYFVDLETQQSSWDPPTHFMDRKELSQALQKADADLKSKPAGDDEATFLAKVKARFPAPPGKPPPPKMNSSLAAGPSLDELKAENARLQARIAELESRDSSSSAAPPPLPPAVASSFNVAAPPPLPLGVSKQASSSPFASPRGGAAPRRVSAVPQWKRGASSMLPLEPPPPPPAWALAMSSSSSKNVVGQPSGMAAKRPSLPAGGGPLHKMGAVPATAGGMPPPLPGGDRRGSAPAYGRQMNAGI